MIDNKTEPVGMVICFYCKMAIDYASHFCGECGKPVINNTLLKSKSTSNYDPYSTRPWKAIDSLSYTKHPGTEKNQLINKPWCPVMKTLEKRQVTIKRKHLKLKQERKEPLAEFDFGSNHIAFSDSSLFPLNSESDEIDFQLSKEYSKTFQTEKINRAYRNIKQLGSYRITWIPCYKYIVISLYEKGIITPNNFRISKRYLIISIEDINFSNIHTEEEDHSNREQHPLITDRDYNTLSASRPDTDVTPTTTSYSTRDNDDVAGVEEKNVVSGHDEEERERRGEARSDGEGPLMNIVSGHDEEERERCGEARSDGEGPLMLEGEELAVVPDALGRLLVSSTDDWIDLDMIDWDSFYTLNYLKKFLTRIAHRTKKSPQQLQLQQEQQQEQQQDAYSNAPSYSSLSSKVDHLYSFIGLNNLPDNNPVVSFDDFDDGSRFTRNKNLRGLALGSEYEEDGSEHRTKPAANRFKRPRPLLFDFNPRTGFGRGKPGPAGGADGASKGSLGGAEEGTGGEGRESRILLTRGSALWMSFVRDPSVMKIQCQHEQDYYFDDAVVTAAVKIPVVTDDDEDAGTGTGAQNDWEGGELAERVPARVMANVTVSLGLTPPSGFEITFSGSKTRNHSARRTADASALPSLTGEQSSVDLANEAEQPIQQKVHTAMITQPDRVASIHLTLYPRYSTLPDFNLQHVFHLVFTSEAVRDILGEDCERDYGRPEDWITHTDAAESRSNIVKITKALCSVLYFTTKSSSVQSGIAGGLEDQEYDYFTCRYQLRLNGVEDVTDTAFADDS